MSASPFEIITPNGTKKSNKNGLIISLVVIAFLIVSVVIGLILVKQNQNVSEKASNAEALCPAAEACPYSRDKTLLRSCHPDVQSDGTPVESVCNEKGRIELCGPLSTKYCCPAVGSAWTTNMTNCTVAAASSSPIPTATATGSPSPRPTATTLALLSATKSPSPSPTPVKTKTPTPVPTKSPSPVPGATKTPTPVPTSTSTSTAVPTVAPTATTYIAQAQTTPRPIPETGTSLPTILGIAFGVLAIIGSFILAF